MSHDTRAAEPRAEGPPLSREGFTRELRGSYPVLWSIARGWAGSGTDADDILQDAVLIGWEKREVFVVGTSFLSWMASIVRNVARNHQRKQARRDHAPLHDHDVVGSEHTNTPTPVDAATGKVQPGQHDFDDRVVKALEQLKPTARACLLLRTVHAMDYATIGEVMDLPKNTALSHVHRARMRMRDLLAPYPQHVDKGARP